MAELVTNRYRAAEARSEIYPTSSGGGETASTWKLMLVTTGFLDSTGFDPDQDFIADDTTNAPLNYELSTNGGYERQTMAVRTVTQDNTNNLAVIDSTNITFSSVTTDSGDNAGAAVLYSEQTASSSQAIMISVYDTNFPVNLNGGDIVIAPSTNGWLSYST
jgi:hypothetical protein